MNKLMISLAAVAAIGAAVPAAAQSYGGYGYNGGYSHNGGYDGYNGGYDRYQGSYERGSSWGGGQVNAREAQLSAQIQRAEMRGQLDRYDALNLRTELGRIELIEKRYRWSGQGLSSREVAEINARLDRVEQRVASVSRYAPRYGYGYGDQRWNGRW